MDSEGFEKSSIYTLVKNGTNKTGQNQLYVNGEGSDLFNIDAVKGRAKRKTRTQIMMLNLIRIAQENGEQELEKSYWNTYYCQQNLISFDGRFYGNYCKNRFCSLCCGIRKADMINRYKPVLEKWNEPYFLTLTVKACKAKSLSKYVNSLNRGIRKIIAKYRKRHQRGKGVKLVGVRSLECNFNPRTKTYNPHFHIITKDKITAEILLTEWLKLCTPKFAIGKAQKMQKVRDLETGLIEIIKYGSKIFTEADLKDKANGKTVYIYLKALDTIFTAMKGKRIFDRFGFNLPKPGRRKTTKPQLLTKYDEWEYILEISDWQHVMTGERLSGYELPSSLQSILDNNIDISTM